MPKRLLKLFAGNPDVHGVYLPPKQKTPDARGKLKGRQWAESAPVTLELWQKHVKGEQGLGVYMLRRDGTVRFAAIDMDVYPTQHKLIARRITDEKLPLVLCKSKSGGAHLYLFGKEDLPASLVRRRLEAWAARLNLYEFVKRKEDKIEVFPKQDSLSGDSDVGNYLNMPYFGDERQALNDDGKVLTLDQFITKANATATTVEALEKLGLDEGEALKDGPPCLQALVAAGPINAYRDNSLLALGVYLKVRDADNWETRLEEYHRQFIGTPLTAKEVLKVQRSVAKKDYNYACKQAPLSTRCNRPVCITRTYGVRAVAEAHGQDTGFNLNLGQLRKFDMDGAPLYELEVDGKWMRMSTETLLNYTAFRKAVFEQLNRMPVRLKAETWDAILEDKLQTMVIEVAPPDVGNAGLVRHHLEQFVRYLPATRKEDLLQGMAYSLPDQQRVWFRSPHFEEYLKKHRVMYTSRDLTTAFRRWGFKHGQINIKGVCIQYWEMPQFDRQNEPNDVPRIPQEKETM